jgi:hypothetical protein
MNHNNHHQDHITPQGKPFFCSWCGTGFGRRSSLLHHRRTVHNPNREWFECGGCRLSFTCRWSLKRHEDKCSWVHTVLSSISTAPLIRTEQSSSPVPAVVESQPLSPINTSPLSNPDVAEAPTEAPQAPPNDLEPIRKRHRRMPDVSISSTAVGISPADVLATCDADSDTRVNTSNNRVTRSSNAHKDMEERCCPCVGHHCSTDECPCRGRSEDCSHHDCGNDYFTSPPTIALRVVTSRDAKGYGVSTKQRLAAGVFVGEYKGRRCRLSTWSGTSDRALFVGNDTLVIANDNELVGFINHSCAPNCETFMWRCGKRECVGIRTLRVIQCGELLTFDYCAGTTAPVYNACTWDHLPCACNSPECRGSITGRGIGITLTTTPTASELHEILSTLQHLWYRNPSAVEPNRNHGLFEIDLHSSSVCGTAMMERLRPKMGV